MSTCVLITGCSGGGKSTLLEEMERRGHAIVKEPGRRIIAQETARGGTALPWQDLPAFAARAVDMAMSDLEQARTKPGMVFFDRGMIDAAVALQHATGASYQSTLSGCPRYDPRVFLAPPWPQIYVQDAERRHTFAEAQAEYTRLRTALADLGYTSRVLPKLSPAARAEFMLGILDQTR